MEHVPPGPRVRRRPLQQRLRAARRAARAQPHRLGGLQLLGAGHRQHGGALPVRHARPERALAAAAARWRDPLRLRDDRARRRLLRRDQHLPADRARRRRVRAQRPQVVVLGDAPPPLPDPDRDGQDNCRRSAPHPAEPDPRAARHARRLDPARAARVRLPGPGGPRRNRLRRRARPRGEPDRRRGRGLHDRPGAARAGAHPPLHARARRRRARPRGDVLARGLTGRRSASRSPRARTSRTGSPSRGSRSRWRGC